MTIAANLDVATVEVDFAKLKIAAGLGSPEEAAEIWESIKHVASSASVTTCTVTQRYARDVSEKAPPWDLNRSRRRLVEQLYTVARDILLFAYKAHLKDPEARIERSKETSTTNAALSKPRNRYTEDRLQVARDDVWHQEPHSSPHRMVCPRSLRRQRS